MKRYIFLLLLSAGAVVSNGQQLQTSSLYDLQGVFHNPAVAGSDKHAMIGVSYRTMWNNIDGGPQTGTLFGSTYLPSAKL